jgi:hypothetical protein
MITYEPAPPAIEALLVRTMEKCQPALHKAGVRISVLLVRREVKKEGYVHALKAKGYPLYAKTQVTSLPDRARGLADAKLVIDAFAWDGLPDRRKAALLDHELQHLDLVEYRPTKRNGWLTGIRHDDLGRPMLRSRPHDWEIAGFAEVVERHAGNSIEAAHFEAFRERFGQLNLFGGVDVPAVTDGKKSKKLKRVK